MSDLKPEPTELSNMLREATGNVSIMLMQIADHIDELEHQVQTLSIRVFELESKGNM